MGVCDGAASSGRVGQPRRRSATSKRPGRIVRPVQVNRPAYAAEVRRHRRGRPPRRLRRTRQVREQNPEPANGQSRNHGTDESDDQAHRSFPWRHGVSVIEQARNESRAADAAVCGSSPAGCRPHNRGRCAIAHGVSLSRRPGRRCCGGVDNETAWSAVSGKLLLVDVTTRNSERCQ
jgi:hypothetical protein